MFRINYTSKIIKEKEPTHVIIWASDLYQIQKASQFLDSSTANCSLSVHTGLFDRNNVITIVEDDGLQNNFMEDDYLRSIQSSNVMRRHESIFVAKKTLNNHFLLLKYNPFQRKFFTFWAEDKKSNQFLKDVINEELPMTGTILRAAYLPCASSFAAVPDPNPRLH